MSETMYMSSTPQLQVQLFNFALNTKHILILVWNSEMRLYSEMSLFVQKLIILRAAQINMARVRSILLSNNTSIYSALEQALLLTSIKHLHGGGSYSTLQPETGEGFPSFLSLPHVNTVDCVPPPSTSAAAATCASYNIIASFSEVML